MADAALKDVIESAVEVAIASQRGDLEIAEDHLKVSAWLAGLATAALYFCFTEVGAIELESPQAVPMTAMAGYLLVANALGFSFLAAYRFRQAHIRFCAFVRNLIVAHSMQRSELLQHIEKIKRPQAANEQAVPLWSLIHTGELYAELNDQGVNPVAEVSGPLEQSRTRMEAWAKGQRRATLWGFVSLILLKTTHVIFQTAM